MTLASRLKRQKLRLPRQRSFSLESELELRTVAKRAVGVAGALASIREARRSISLKSSPLHFPWSFRRESSSAMREGGVFAELRRSSEIFRNILLSIAGRDESTPTGKVTSFFPRPFTHFPIHCNAFTTSGFFYTQENSISITYHVNKNGGIKCENNPFKWSW